MDYSHYFPATSTHAFTDAEWIAITDATKKVFDARKDILANEDGGLDTEPEAISHGIYFNGIGDAAHESFSITKKYKNTSNSCKTNYKSYDVVVVAVLCIIYSIAPNVLIISSDGEVTDWQDGLRLARTVLPGATCPIFDVEDEESGD